MEYSVENLFVIVARWPASLYDYNTEVPARIFTDKKEAHEVADEENKTVALPKFNPANVTDEKYIVMTLLDRIKKIEQISYEHGSERFDE